MTFKTFKRLALTTLAACASVVAAPVAAQAAPSGNIVTLGDSYTADPDQVRNTLRDIPSGPIHDYVWSYPNKNGCLQAPNNWPRQLGKMSGRPIADHSCTAETSPGMLGHLDAAIQSGDLNKNTGTVAVAVGMNNYGAFGWPYGFNPLDPNSMRQGYIRDMKIAKDKIKSVSPNAQIMIVGSLSVSDPFGYPGVCVLNVIPNVPGGRLPAGTLQAAEIANRDNQIAAAKQLDLDYVEVKEGSKMHSTCARDDKQRYVTAGIDTTTPEFTMSLHPSGAGSRYIAEQVNKILK